MPNQDRKRSDYVITLSEEQAQRLAEIAEARGQTADQVLLDALDRFIQTEKQSQLPPAKAGGL